MKMSKNRMNILEVLLKHPKISDRKAADLLNISQPTVTRIRTKLVKAGLLTFSAYPDLAQLGFAIVGFTELHYEYGTDDLLKEIQKEREVVFITKQPSRLFVISVHKDIATFEIFQAAYPTIINSMHIVTANAITKKPIGFSHLIKTEK